MDDRWPSSPQIAPRLLMKGRSSSPGSRKPQHLANCVSRRRKEYHSEAAEYGIEGVSREPQMLCGSNINRCIPEIGRPKRGHIGTTPGTNIGQFTVNGDGRDTPLWRNCQT